MPQIASVDPVGRKGSCAVALAGNPGSVGRGSASPPSPPTHARDPVRQLVQHQLEEIDNEKASGNRPQSTRIGATMMVSCALALSVI
jgi:hypothetical protein